MKKTILGLVLSGMFFSASNAGIKSALTGAGSAVKNNKVKTALIATGVVATGVAIYDLTKGEDSVIKNLAAKTPEAASKVKQFIKTHPYATATTVLALAEGTEIAIRGKNSFGVRGAKKLGNFAVSTKNAAKNIFKKKAE